MFEAMEYFKEGEKAYTRKLRRGFFQSFDDAVAFAKVKAKGIPYIQEHGKCVWSPLSDRLNKERLGITK